MGSGAFGAGSDFDGLSLSAKDGARDNKNSGLSFALTLSAKDGARDDKNSGLPFALTLSPSKGERDAPSYLASTGSA